MLCALLGILAPMFVAGSLILPNAALRDDCRQRLGNFHSGGSRHWLLAALIMPASILVAITLSIPLGFSAAQFQLHSQPTFSAGGASPWAALVAIPVFEELAWHSYGTDTLRRRWSLFSASMIFSAFWGLWHAPLALINGYYHSNLIETGIWETINFPVSIFPVVFLMNWLYYRAGRNLWIAALFHVTSGFFNELFSPHPLTKLIQTGVLLILAATVVLRERKLFFVR
jgi:membrane protease YdiL (CAAX protease family)